MQQLGFMANTMNSDKSQAALLQMTTNRLLSDRSAQQASAPTSAGASSAMWTGLLNSRFFLPLSVVAAAGVIYYVVYL